MKYLNNPFNIRYSTSNRWKGLLGNNNGFCTFVSLQLGVRAAAYLLMVSYRKLGLDTIEKILFRFAPLSENRTYDYIRFICDKTHISPDVKINSVFAYASILKWMWFYESGYSEYQNVQFILDVIRQYKIRMA